jgi:hypothetical protein
MTDEELADAVVALGVGEPWGENFPGCYRLGVTDMLSVDAYAFVRDWRVAGALMEKLRPFDSNIYFWNGMACVKVADNMRIENKSLPRAIIEACVEALAAVDKEGT